MAMNVKFLKGLKAALPTTRDNTTLYFVTDEGALYLGNTLIGADYTSALEAVNAAIKVINDHGYVNSTEVATSIATELEKYYTKEQVDAKIGTLKIGDVSYDSVVDYVIAKTTGIATDSVVAGKADKVVPATPGNFATLGEDGNLVDSGKDLSTLEGMWNDDIVSVVDEKISVYDADTIKPWVASYISGLEFELVDKEIQLKNENGDVVASLDATEFIADGMLQSVVADQNNNTLTFTWNTDAGVQVTTIELSSIADIYTGSEGTEVKVAVSNENVISATLSDTVKADIAKGVDAQTRVGVIEGKEATWDAKQNALTEAQLAAANSGITAEKVGQYDTVKSTVDNLGDLASKNEADLNLGQYAKTADIEDSLAKADSAVQNNDSPTFTALTVNSHMSADEYNVGNSTYKENQIVYGYIKDGLEYNTLLLPKKVEGVDGDETLATQEWVIGYSPSVGMAYDIAREAASEVQGATTNTIKDCVDAINTMNNQTGEVIGTVENIVNQLTWGEF